MLDSRPGRIVTYVVAAAVLLALGVRAFGGAQRAPSVGPVRIQDGAGSTDAGLEPERAWVDVAGAVRRPGLYRVPAGARVGQVVERAGGLRQAGTGAVNLAAPVRDGQQIVIARRAAGTGAADTPTAAQAGQMPAAASSPAATPPAAIPQGAPAAGGAAVSLAAATAEEIDAAAEGIGPTLAARIVEYRTENGGFASVEDLRRVPGIGEVRFQALADAFGP